MGGTSHNSNTLEETFNYEISRTTETTVTEAGAVKRLSVAVVVDGIYTYDAAGNADYAPRSQAELDQINALVRSAMGFDAERGDQVEVVNMQFAQRPDVTAGTEAPGLFDFTREDLMRFVEMAVTLLIGLALVLFVMRPLVRKVLAPENQPLALPPAAAVPATELEDDTESDAVAAAKAAGMTEPGSNRPRRWAVPGQDARMVGDLVERTPSRPR